MTDGSKIAPPAVQHIVRNNHIENFRPMLSASLPTGQNSDLLKLDWTNGLWASPKIDGIRAVKHPEHGLVSRTLKPIRNKYIQEVLSSPELDFFDGELIVGGLYDMVNFNDTQSAIMSAEGKPDFTYCIFDDISNPMDGFHIRTMRAKKRIEALAGKYPIIWLQQVICTDDIDLLQYESTMVMKGFEGVIIRHPGCSYKNNRSTFKQQGMIKLKRFTDAEAEIIGFEELYRNNNEPIIDKLGYQKRSGHKENQVPAGVLGLFKVRGINGRFKGVEFGCGSGLDDSLRSKIWGQQESYLGKIIKYKFQDHGSKVAPRSPIFLGFRHKDDM